MNNRICVKCGVVEFEGNFHPNPVQDKCHECCAKYPVEDIATEFPDYDWFEFHEKQVRDAIYARRKIRTVRERVEGLPAEEWPVWKFDATRLDDLWKK